MKAMLMARANDIIKNTGTRDWRLGIRDFSQIVKSLESFINNKRPKPSCKENIQKGE
jgi:hypothetical protein